jgi:hypothetical protein
MDNIQGSYDDLRYRNYWYDSIFLFYKLFILKNKFEKLIY